MLDYVDDSVLTTSNGEEGEDADGFVLTTSNGEEGEDADDDVLCGDVHPSRLHP
jgi:hypothetical protein